ncbi:MAG TPA: gephyrin-like molybdotransferase Glp [Bauldia sp.]|nr:gephyrin-like molybdotransferase Glp [Bauldia sp.]
MSLLPVAEAVARVVAGVTPLPAETVPLSEAAGRVLAEDLPARRTHPPFAASAMDGYALRAADAAAGAVLRVVGMAAAGRSFAGSVSTGEAARIFTGAPIPDGADSVLIQEDAEVLPDGRIRVREAPRPGRHIRRAGLDFTEGAVLLSAGARLGFREVSLAAAMGHGAVPVRRRPRVALLATGDELVPPGASPGPDQIVSSNAVGLAALVASLGGAPHDFGIVSDDAAAIAAAVRRALTLPADVVVTIGGASVGEHDLAQKALESAGMRLDFWKVAIRPGKPLMFGVFAATPDRPAVRVLGLPGNPVSALVGGLVFLAPLLSALLGAPYPDMTEPARLGVDVPANDSREDYLRSKLVPADDGLPRVSPLTPQDSSMLSTLVVADCLLIRPPHAPPGHAGELCRILRLP